MMRKWTEHDSISAESEMDMLLYGLVRMLKPRIVVETGTYHAIAAAVLGTAVRENDYGHVWTCDIVHPGEELQRLAGLPVTFVHGSSFDLPELRTADFVFSDSGQHEDRMKEYELVKPRCVFVVHDTCISYSADGSDEFVMAKWLRANGGLNFPAGRGFGLLVKPFSNKQQ